MNWDIQRATRTIFKGKLIALIYPLINALAASDGAAGSMSSIFFMIFVFIDLAMVLSLGKRIYITRKDTLEFQSLRHQYNVFMTAVLITFTASAVCIFFVSPLFLIAMLLLHALRIKGEYALWKIMNEDFIEKMKKRAKKAVESLRSSSAGSPGFAGAGA